MSNTEIIGPSGNRAEVSDSKRILSSAAFYDMLAKVSADDAEAYIMYSGQMVIPSHANVTPLNDAPGPGQTSRGYAVHWFRNSHATKNLIIHSASWGSNGGSDPSKSQIFECKPIFASHLLPPTDNISTLFETIPKRQNIANQSLPEIEAYGWNSDTAAAVPNGLDMPIGSYNPARKIMNFLVQRGYQDTSFESAFILPPGSPAILHIFDAPSLLAGETLDCHITIKAWHAPVCNPWLGL